MDTLSEQDLKRWREHSLRPQLPKSSKAEQNFDKLIGLKDGGVSKKDYDTVIGLYDKIWELQNMITDEDETDGQMQRAYIDQQNDILDELEIVYKKYLPK